MSRYLRQRRGRCLAVAICDRCHMKVYLDELVADGNAPGLRVCTDCSDVFDPYRLSPPAPDRLVLKYPRPEVEVPLDEPDTIGTEFGESIDFPPEIHV